MCECDSDWRINSWSAASIITKDKVQLDTQVESIVFQLNTLLCSTLLTSIWGGTQSNISKEKLSHIYPDFNPGTNVKKIKNELNQHSHVLFSKFSQVFPQSLTPNPWLLDLVTLEKFLGWLWRSTFHCHLLLFCRWRDAALRLIPYSTWDTIIHNMGHSTKIVENAVPGQTDSFKYVFLKCFLNIY